MTHDELSIEINKADLGWFYEWMKDALLAVLKLHEPIASLTIEGSFYCGECGVYDELCETLKAIEKELA